MYGETIVLLTPKEFEVLLLLVESSNQTVEKSILLEKIWQNTYVEEGTLTRNISWLRKKIAAHHPENLKIIETVPKVGYRLLPPVTIYEAPLEGTSDAQEKDSSPLIIDKNFSENPAPEKNTGLSPVASNKTISKIFVLIGLLTILACIFIIYKALISKLPEVLIASKIVPFSGLPGRETAPAFSPDGKQIVYSWDGGIADGNLDIYIKLIGAGEPVRLTNNQANETNPVFSPDGKTIVFLRLNPEMTEIIQISALGGDERKIYSQVGNASVSFSPDGKYLAVADHNHAKNHIGIYLVDLQTQKETQLTAPPLPSVDFAPRFAPDGKSLAFIRRFSSFRSEIFIVPTAGGAPQQITFDNVSIDSIAWSSDGENLFFVAARPPAHSTLWRISVGGGKESQMILTNIKNVQDLAIAPDGKMIAFVEELFDENIWEIQPNTAPRPLIRSIRADHSPDFSPDGTQIVFSSDRTGNYEIWLANSNGNNQRRLTVSAGSAGSPHFSPDGKQIVYDVQSEKGESNLFIVSVNGGEPRRLTNDQSINFMPIWSADGQSIFFSSNRTGINQMWKIPAAGGEAVQITKDGAFEAAPLPDGKTIVYSKRERKLGLWQVNTNGTDEKPIPELADVNGWRSWTIAGNGIYFTAFGSQPPYQINFFDFETRRISNVTSVEKSPLSYYSNLAATRNKLLYAQRDQNAGAIFLAEFEENH